MQNLTRCTAISVSRRLGRSTIFCICCALASGRLITGQEPGAALDPALGISTLRLWNGPAPGAKGEAPADIPTLTLLRPEHANGTAVIVDPGGAYLYLAANHEGRQPADRLASLGVTVFILKYRLTPQYLYPAPLEDARRAVRMVRMLASTYGYAPDRIGMLGFSAGGHLAAMAGVTPEPGKAKDPDPVERQSSEINFMVLIYPWLNAMQPQVNSPAGPMINYCSVTKVLTQADCARFNTMYTPVTHVGTSTPPAILFATSDDNVVPVTTSVEFYSAMHAAGRDAALHLFAHGPHGFGTGGGDLVLSSWLPLLENWMRVRGLLTPLPAPQATAQR